MAKKTRAESAVERMLGEWKRSMLTFWTLGLLMIRPMCGLEIKQEIESSTQGKMKLGPGAIYQLLRRLEKNKLVKSRWKQTKQGPPRAYYYPTAAGRQVVRRYMAELFTPGSPISSALGELVSALLQQLLPEPKQPGKKRLLPYNKR